MGRGKLTFFLGPSAILRIFALGGGSLRLISQDSLVNFKVQLKKWLFVIMFALEGFLILILLAQTFFVTKKRTHKSDKFLLERLSYFISWFVPMDSLSFQPLGGTPPLRCGDLGINRSKNHQFRKEITELKIRRRDIEASSLPTTNFTDIPNLAKDSVLFFFFLQEGGWGSSTSLQTLNTSPVIIRAG